MSEDNKIKFGQMELYNIETIVPGICILILAVYAEWIPPKIFESIKILNGIYANELIIGLFLLSSAYVLGAISASLCRLIMDTTADWFPTPFWLWSFEMRDKGFPWPWPFPKDSRVKILEEYNATRKEGINSSSPAVVNSIIRYRTQTRILRSSSAPVTLFVFINWDALSAIITFIILIFLFASSELAIYQQAKKAKK